jgi:vacuolar-type H+-ATPase subunit H
MSRRDPAHPVANAPAGDLAQLVAMEVDLEQRLTRAREESDSLLAEATREAKALAQAFEDHLAALQVSRRRQLDLDQHEEEARILAEGVRRAQWYDHLPEAREIELAGYVVDRLLGRSRP